MFRRGRFSVPCCLTYTGYQWPVSSNAITFNTTCTLTTLGDVLLRIDDCVRELRQWLANNKRLLNKDKTEAITFRSSSARPSTYGSVISVCGATILLKMVVPYIRLYLDSHLDMSAQVSNACRGGAYFHLFRIAKIRAT